MPERGHVVAFLGLTHDHAWGHLQELANRRDITAIRAVETHRVTAARAKAAGVAVVRDSREALAGASVAIACGPTAHHVDAVRACADAGVAIMVEKPLAIDGDAAERISAHARAAGLPVMVNWPTAWFPALRSAAELASGGAIGRVHRVDVHLGHGGPAAFGCSPAFTRWLLDESQNGPGVFADYAGYGALIADQLLGPPRRAMAWLTRSRRTSPPDDAHLVLEYGDERLATVTVSWTHQGAVPADLLTVRGSSGSLAVRFPPTRGEGAPSGRGWVVLRTHHRPAGVRVRVPRPSAVNRSAVGHLLACLDAGRPFDPWVQLATAVRVTSVLDAGASSSRAGRPVAVQPP